jgi:hypothetical protein
MEIGQRVSRPTWRAALIALCLVGLAWFYVKPLVIIRADSGGSTTFDDAYMFARYAHHLLSGDGLAWNAGAAPTYGLTSLPYVFVVAAGLAAVPLDDGTVLPLLSWGLAGLAVAVLAVTVIVHTRQRPAIVPLIALGCLMWLVDSHAFAFHATTGMDTTLALLATSLLAVCWLWVARLPHSAQAIVLAVCGYVCYAIRPDTIIYAAALPAGLLLIASPVPRWRDAVIALVGLGALIALDTAIKLAVFGDWVPLSFYAKQAGFYEGYLGGWRWNQLDGITAVLSTVMPCLVILVCAVNRDRLRMTLVYLLPVVVTFAYFSRIMQIMGHFGRYYLPAVPFIFVASVLALRDLHWPKSLEIRPLVLRAGLAATIGFLIPWLSNEAIRAERQAYRADLAENGGRPTSLPSVDYWTSLQALAALMRELPPGSVVAASEVGLIGAEAPRVYIIDLVGLHDEDIAHHGFHVDRVLARQPDLIWIPHYDYARIVHDLESDDGFRRDYAYCPGFLQFGIAVRNDSPHADAIKASLTELSRTLYATDAS